MATMVTRARLEIALNVHCLSISCFIPPNRLAYQWRSGM